MDCSVYSEEYIEKRLEEAFEVFCKNDSYLLEVDANERSISHKLAIYLEQIFPTWNVDCEYNRANGEIKRRQIIKDKLDTIDECKQALDDNDAKTVYPDIIVHKRGTNDNLLVIELRKSTSKLKKEKYDEQKLKELRHDLNYCFALALEVKTGKDYNKDMSFSEMFPYKFIWS